MGDANEAQFNAVVDSFGDGNVEYLMRFCHMITKLYEHGKTMTPAKLALVAADVYNMHYAVSESLFRALKTMAALLRSGSAIEHHRRLLQQTTLSRRSRILFGRCCTPENFFGVKFAELAKSTAKLRWRATETRRMKLIEKMATLPGSYEESDESDYVLVCVHPTPRIYVRPQKQTMEVIEVCAQMGLNNARVERDGQPEAGWAVNVRDRTCPCKYFFKHGECVHLYFAFVNRSQRNRKRGLAEDIHDTIVAQQSSRGRPILNGPALSLV
ncbi:hypothetical protein F442_09187 [Phytophthora nicotianae P10297]|uniref:SWIM-type domain-containing protein n=1 Tax=Phytophthora nicotianae P10297 TaxID=1317064 RepID=W2ZAC7_PHYNI|nr:hypothetical protein F442_09187 [Phytophthora nicotianae P10297]